MNKRKQNVVNKAHELFIEKGYHATSIQDILNHSEISKGSFYNYFPSKGALFKAVFTSINSKLEAERDAMLFGEDVTDIGIFTNQVTLVLELNKKNRLIQLVEDVFVSNDPELIMFIKQSRFLFLKWIHERFINLFSEDQKPYLFDCAILFAGFLQNMLQISYIINENETVTLKQIINYCIDRIITIVEEVTEKGIQLFPPDKVRKLAPDSDNTDFFYNEFSFATLSLKKTIEKVFETNDPQICTYIKLMNFIQEEIMNNKEPRVFLIESALLSLKMCAQFNETKEFEDYQKIVAEIIKTTV